MSNEERVCLIFNVCQVYHLFVSIIAEQDNNSPLSFMLLKWRCIPILIAQLRVFIEKEIIVGA